jgi:hypothetical protein
MELSLQQILADDGRIASRRDAGCMLDAAVRGLKPTAICR